MLRPGNIDRNDLVNQPLSLENRYGPWAGHNRYMRLWIMNSQIFQKRGGHDDVAEVPIFYDDDATRFLVDFCALLAREIQNRPKEIFETPAQKEPDSPIPDQANTRRGVWLAITLCLKCAQIYLSPFGGATFESRTVYESPSK